MTRKHRTAIALAVIAAFSLGWGASREYDGSRFTVRDGNDTVRAYLGHDEHGNGTLQILDSAGRMVFEVRQDAVIAFGEVVAAPDGMKPVVESDAGDVVELADSSVLQFISSEEVKGDPAGAARLIELRNLVDSLEQQIKELMDEVRGETNSTIRNTKVAQMNERKQRGRDAEAEIRQLEREQNEIRQRITCWNGAQTVVLHTRRNFRSIINSIERNDFLTWEGERLEGASPLTFLVDRIRQVRAPQDFNLKR